MAWNKKTLKDGSILFWDRAKHTQVLCNTKDPTGAGYIKDPETGKEYFGCWSSRPEVVREVADPGFVGENEYVDREGEVWYINVFAKDDDYYSERDDGTEIKTEKLIPTKLKW